MIPALLLAASLFGVPTFSYGSHGAGNQSTFTYGLGLVHAAALLGWFASIARRRMPHGLRDSVAWGLGYGAQLWAYLFLLTSRYPDSDPEIVLGGLSLRSDPISIRGSRLLTRRDVAEGFRFDEIGAAEREATTAATARAIERRRAGS